jgi:hypothetical protein
VLLLLSSSSGMEEADPIKEKKRGCRWGGRGGGGIERLFQRGRGIARTFKMFGQLNRRPAAQLHFHFSVTIELIR